MNTESASMVLSPELIQAVKMVVVETLEEISKSASSEPPDKLTLFLYHFAGDFQTFKKETKDRFEKIDGRLDGIDGRLDGIDGRLDGIDGRLDGIDGRLDGIDGRLDGIDGRLDGIEQNMFTKKDWQEEKLRLIEGIAVEFKKIINKNK